MEHTQPARDDVQVGAPDESLCVVCMEGPRSHLLVPCGHLCLCQRCASHRAWEACPLCREVAQQVIRLYS